MSDMDQYEWLLVRKAAMQWVEQVKGAQPGPEPLMTVVNNIIKDHVRREKIRSAGWDE